MHDTDTIIIYVGLCLGLCLGLHDSNNLTGE